MKNNPFLRLKHYMRSEIDPQENHATECLAACLVFSSKLRDAFIQFLLNAERGKDFGSTDAEVLTQERIEGGPIESEEGYIDLVLRQPETFVIAVEVKIRSPENCKHHQNQLLRYKAWLDEQTKEPRRFLFTLVRNADTAFHPEQYGADGRRTWWALYKNFQQMLRANNLSDVEFSLIKNFCDYLEIESIVSNWQTKQILNYGNGLIARNALRTLFDQVGEKLTDLNEKEYLKEPVVDKDDQWPRLEIGMKSWSPIFGSKAYLKKLRMYYETVAVPLWEGKAERFNFEILLWNKWEKGESDWRKIQPQLPRWVQYFKSQNFYHKAYGKGDRELEGKGAEEGQFTDPPSWISAWASDPKQQRIEESDWLKMSEEELVNELLDRVLHHCKVISGLPHS